MANNFLHWELIKPHFDILLQVKLPGIGSIRSSTGLTVVLMLLKFLIPQPTIEELFLTLLHYLTHMQLSLIQEPGNLFLYCVINKTVQLEKRIW